jgi:hypothetical protein
MKYKLGKKNCTLKVTAAQFEALDIIHHAELYNTNTFMGWLEDLVSDCFLGGFSWEPCLSHTFAVLTPFNNAYSSLKQCVRVMNSAPTHILLECSDKSTWRLINTIESPYTALICIVMEYFKCNYNDGLLEWVYIKPLVEHLSEGVLAIAEMLLPGAAASVEEMQRVLDTTKETSPITTVLSNMLRSKICNYKLANADKASAKTLADYQAAVTSAKTLAVDAAKATNVIQSMLILDTK